MTPMRTCPVELATIWATGKVRVMFGDKRRHLWAGLSRCDVLKNMVADNTAAQRLLVNRESGLKLGLELPQLVRHEIAANKSETAPNGFPLDQISISGQKASIFIQDSIDDRSVGNVPLIRAIIAKDAKPSGQFAQHGINEKFLSRDISLSHDTICFGGLPTFAWVNMQFDCSRVRLFTKEGAFHADLFYPNNLHDIPQDQK